MDARGVKWAAAKMQIRLSTRFSDKFEGWVEAHCPLAPHSAAHRHSHDANPSFGIRVKPDGTYSTFKCFTCKAKGTLAGLSTTLGKLRGYDGTALTKEIRDLERAAADRPLDAWDEDEEDDLDAEIEAEADHSRRDKSGLLRTLPSAAGHPYLRKRGIDIWTAARLELLDHREHSRILFPVRDHRGKVAGYTGRLYRGTPTKRNPKVRDYAGLPKRDLLLGSHRVRRGHGANAATHPLVVVEGLFAYARFVNFRVPNVVALLGSELTPGKAELIVRFGLPVVWFVDGDMGGQSCLYGPIDPLYDMHDLEKGALHDLYGQVPQRVVEYPTWTDDPDDLSREEVFAMIEGAELYVKPRKRYRPPA